MMMNIMLLTKMKIKRKIGIFQVIIMIEEEAKSVLPLPLPASFHLVVYRI
jgi:hypothetical protein